MPTKHKKMLKFTHEKGLSLLEDMNMLMFGFGPDAEEYKKKKRSKKNVWMVYEVDRAKAKKGMA